MNRWWWLGMWTGWLALSPLAAQEPAAPAPALVEPAPLPDEPAAPATEPVLVTITLANGTKIEGTLRSETEKAVVIEQELAGGTITQTKTIARTNIVALTRLEGAELERRLMEQAWQNVERYQLNSQTSYSAGYYDRVIDNVLEPFLSRYPESPHAGAAAEKLVQWQTEYRQVAGGMTKYQGRWMKTDEAGRLIAQQQGAQLIQQARADLQRGRYSSAVERLRFMTTAEAQDLTRQAYDRWLKALEAEEVQLRDGLIKAEQQIANAISTKQQMEAASRRRVEGLGAGEQPFLGASQDEIITLNRATNEITAGSNQLQRVQARLRYVEKELGKVKPLAQKAGVETAKTASSGAAVVGEPVRDIQSPVIERETDWNNPSLLRKLAGFFRDYWMYLAGAAALILWYFTRKLAK